MLPVFKCISIHRMPSVYVGWVNICTLIVIVSGPKFTIFFVQCDKNLVDNAIYRLSTPLCFPEIFAIKVESCPKSHQILTIF